VREKTKFMKQFNVDSTVQSLREKYFASVFPKSVAPLSPSRLDQRGAYRDRHERGARDAVDAGGVVHARLQSQGEEIRER
jgi:hypothetical protein